MNLISRRANDQAVHTVRMWSSPMLASGIRGIGGEDEQYDQHTAARKKCECHLEILLNWDGGKKKPQESIWSHGALCW